MVFEGADAPFCFVGPMIVGGAVLHGDVLLGAEVLEFGRCLVVELQVAGCYTVFEEPCVASAVRFGNGSSSATWYRFNMNIVGVLCIEKDDILRPSNGGDGEASGQVNELPVAGLTNPGVDMGGWGRS